MPPYTRRENQGDATEMERLGSAEAVLAVLEAVRRALADLLASVDLDTRQGREMGRELGLDRNLSCRIARVIRAEDILAAAPDMPTRRHVEKLCTACWQLGAPAQLLDRAREAVREFEQAVDECAGDRRQFEAMISGLIQDDVTQRQEVTRKLTFLGNLALWGVQTRVNFKTLIYAPSAVAADKMDVVRMGGLIDFKRARPIEWPIYGLASFWDDGSVVPSSLQALDEQSPDLPLIPSFCSLPIPEIARITTEHGVRFHLPAGKFGAAGSLDCVFGDVLRSENNLHRIPGVDEEIGSINELITPSEFVVHDVFFHRDIRLPQTPEVMIIDRLSLPRGLNPGLDEQHRLPLSTPFMRVSAGAVGSALKQYPRYSELLQFALGRMGWLAEDFIGYRFTMSYPPIPAAIAARVPMPEKRG